MNRPRAARRGAPLLALALAAAAVAGCGAGEGPAPAEDLQGLVLLSIHGLRSDRLGAYGSPRGLTPHLDRLAEESTVFEAAVTPYPSELTAHLSLLSGLTPAEHGVVPPSRLPAPEIPRLAESLSRFGLATGGFTHGGFVTRTWGFGRGFEHFEAAASGEPGGGERAFARALRFLERLGDGERFFLFLHLRVLAPPFEAPGGGRRGPAAPGAVRAAVAELDLGLRVAETEERRRLADLYDRSLAYADGLVGRLRAALDGLPPGGRTALAVTADHGYELFEHGGLGHHQLYPEVVRVPLVVHDPRRPGPRRIARPARLEDVAATLSRLVRAPPPPGASDVDLLRDPPAAGAWRPALSAVGGWAPQRSAVAAIGGRTLQLVETRLVAEPDGAWITRSFAFDVEGPAVDIRLVSFLEPRSVAVEVDGAPRGVLEVGTGWGRHRLELPDDGATHRVRLATPGCASPRRTGLGRDARCLSVKVDGVTLRRLELFDWTADPGAQRDLTRQGVIPPPALVTLVSVPPGPPVARPGWLEVTPEVRRALRTMGYVD